MTGSFQAEFKFAMTLETHCSLTLNSAENFKVQSYDLLVLCHVYIPTRGS